MNISLIIRIIIAFSGVLFLTRYLNNTINDAVFIFIAGMYAYGVAGWDTYLIKYYYNKKGD